MAGFAELAAKLAGLAEVHARLKYVVVDCRPALDVICREDTVTTLFYLDPPYLHETRANGAKEYGEHEMDDRQHAELLDTVRAVKGKVMLSGYLSDMYDQALSDWNRHDFDLPNAASSSKSKGRETECVWTNY